MRIPRLLFTLSVLGIVSISSAALSQVVLQSSVFGGGFTVATDGRTLVAGTLSQAVIGPVTSGTNLLGQGFWYTLSPLPTSGVRYEPVVAGSAVVLHQNTPNPFSTTTEIAFEIPRNGYVSLKLFDVLGHEIRTLLDGVRDAGRVTVTVSAADLESGYYTARLVADGATRTITMLVVR